MTNPNNDAVQAAVTEEAITDVTTTTNEEVVVAAPAGEPLGTKLPRPDLGVQANGEPTYAIAFDAQGGSTVYKWVADGLYAIDPSMEMDPTTGGLRTAGSGTTTDGGGAATLGAQGPAVQQPSQTSRSVNKRGGSLVDLNRDDFYTV